MKRLSVYLDLIALPLSIFFIVVSLIAYDDGAITKATYFLVLAAFIYPSRAAT